ncbi:MAG: hypothetical protein HY393_00235 [Candidatus Diapherotrites archaeon]|nr:hypothetical protein [Candidatus Diapherotrites archaeon]
MNSKAQVSVEYLVTVAFGIVLATLAALIALQVVQIATVAEVQVQQVRQETIGSLMGG